jgi:hypothetical protein
MTPSEIRGLTPGEFLALGYFAPKIIEQDQAAAAVAVSMGIAPVVGEKGARALDRAVEKAAQGDISPPVVVSPQNIGSVLDLDRLDQIREHRARARRVLSIRKARHKPDSK